MDINIYSIGFTQKNAEDFFKLLTQKGVKRVIDIRLNRTSQLSAFARYPDIEYFLKLHDIEYVYYDYLAPTEDLRKRYNDKKSDNKMTFGEYAEEFNNILKERKAILKLAKEEENLDGSCYFCSEDDPYKCHRSLVINAILEVLTLSKFCGKITVEHLVSNRLQKDLEILQIFYLGGIINERDNTDISKF